ncbi:hypothetical protein AAG906_016956 [Vitis piasezkii]
MVVKMVKRKRGLERNSKTGFKHFLEMDMKKNITAKDDLKWERKLAKKLRVKEGKLWGVDDGINSLFEEIPSVVDSLGREIFGGSKFSLGKEEKLGLVVETSSGDVALEHISIKMCSSKKHEKELLEQGPEGEMAHMVAIRVAKPVKTFGPEVIMEKAPALEESLLNRLSESNLESITKEMVTIFHSVDRGVSSQIITEEVLASCSGGQRGNEHEDCSPFSSGIMFNFSLSFCILNLNTLIRFLKHFLLVDWSILVIILFFGESKEPNLINLTVLMKKLRSFIYADKILIVIMTCLNCSLPTFLIPNPNLNLNLNLVLF